jgi:chromatin remodeling complex protein RSC6
MTPERANFVNPSKISNELCDFIGIERGTSLSRKDVAHKINNYIIKNNLRDSINIRIIYPDDKLKQLLNVPENVQLTYLNLHKYICHHFLNY